MATLPMTEIPNVVQTPGGRQAKNRRSLWDRRIASRALLDALRKLSPHSMMRNPVMFVVEIGSVITTLMLIHSVAAHTGGFRFNLQICLWLWFTVLFANFAEAMAEGRGKAQADSLRKTKSETQAKKLANGNGKIELTPASALRKGDVVVCEPNDIIPGDGDVIEGIASVDESVITGERAPEIRESGGARGGVPR